MGVPTYFYWLVSKFEKEILAEALTTNGQNDNEENTYELKDIQTDNLYLDLNCAIHPAVKKPGLQNRAKMYQAVVDYLETIVDLVNPKKLIYIAIDGVAPKAKMQQQRKRRYKNIQDKELIDQIKRKHKMPVEDNPPGSGGNPTGSGGNPPGSGGNPPGSGGNPPEDFNMISPGTQFMEDLSEILVNCIKRNKIGKWRDLQVIFSDAKVPGEGEHKIMEHIRNSPNLTDRNTIYGLDSDLIFLCLCNFRKNMNLVREKLYFGKRDPKVPDDGSESIRFVYMSIDNLRDVIIRILNPFTSLTDLENMKVFGISKYDNYTEETELIFDDHREEMEKSNFFSGPSEEYNLIMDYVFMCFLLGNDFLPPLPSLKIREGGLDQLIRVYKVIQLHQKNYLMLKNSPTTTSNYNNNSCGWEINIPFLKDLLYQFTLLEDSMLQNQTKRRHYRIGSFYDSDEYTQATPYEKDILELEYVENKVKDLIQLGYSGWKDRYYEFHFHIENRNIYEFGKNINKICQNYLQGLTWTLNYYLGPCPDWNWEYEYHSSPTVSDLFECLNKNNPNAIKFIKHKPVQPFQQLLIILPPASSHLLPKPYADLMTNIKSPLICYFPTDFHLDAFNYRYRWECHPLLPQMNIQMLKNVSKLKDQYLSIEERNRNRFGEVKIFD